MVQSTFIGVGLKTDQPVPTLSGFLVKTSGFNLLQPKIVGGYQYMRKIMQTLYNSLFIKHFDVKNLF